MLQANANEVDILWASDWYDGPLSGMCMYKGQKYWYEVAGQMEDYHFVYYLLVLSAEQLAYEEARQALFCKHVSTYHDFRSEERKQHPQSEWDKFYSVYPADSDKTFPYGETCQAVAWFTYHEELPRCSKQSSPVIVKTYI